MTSDEQARVEAGCRGLRLAYIVIGTFCCLALAGMVISVPFAIYGDLQQRVFGVVVLLLMPMYLFTAVPGLHETAWMLRRLTSAAAPGDGGGSEEAG